MPNDRTRSFVGKRGVATLHIFPAQASEKGAITIAEAIKTFGNTGSTMLKIKDPYKESASGSKVFSYDVAGLDPSVTHIRIGFEFRPTE